MIPKIIWQTYKTSVPPLISNRCVASWIEQNPEYSWYYFDDSKCRQFILDYFDQEFCKMYDSLPVGVMRADVWRVAIVYIFGGVYADIDTRCLKPISEWIQSDYELVVGVETPDGELNNYVFAAKPEHPALYFVLKKMITTYQSSDYLSLDSKTPVQNFGANAFSRGILEYYGQSNEESMLLGGQGNYYNTIPKVQNDSTKFYSYTEHRFSPYVSDTTFVEHQVGSENWKHPSYFSWRAEQKNILGV